MPIVSRYQSRAQCEANLNQVARSLGVGKCRLILERDQRNARFMMAWCGGRPRTKKTMQKWNGVAFQVNERPFSISRGKPFEEFQCGKAKVRAEMRAILRMRE